MTNPDDEGIHPITTHLRDAAEHIRLANHASHGDRREVTELYDTFGTLSALVNRLPQLVAHLHRVLDQADARLYETDCGLSTVETLNTAQLATDEAFSKIATAGNALDDAWSTIGHLRIHDTGTDPA
jgi:ABC-type transporter Mla subunit MlaD